MKKVLFIGAGAPWRGGAGYLVRQRMFLRAFGELAQVQMALFDLPDGAASDAPSFVQSIASLPKIPRKSLGTIGRLAADLLMPTPRMFLGYQPAAARKTVQSLHVDSFDAVFAFRIDFAFFAGVLGHPRLLLDIDDPEHLRWRRQLEATTATGGDWRTRHDLDKLARFEKRAARSAIASFVCQENDRAAFDPPPIVVPNCVDVPAALPPRKADRPSAILIGNFAAASPNVDALRWFLDDIWPLVRREVPDAEFRVVGKLAGELLDRVTRTPGAAALGFVADLSAAMASASLSLAPIRYGTGTRVKIIESFALGCPVVSTTLGCEGINARDGRQILIGDAPADFARQCVALMKDTDLQVRIAAGGHEVAATHYNEAARRPTLVKTLDELLLRCSSRIMQRAPAPTAQT